MSYIEITGASDDLIEIDGDIREEFNVLGMEDAYIAASNGFLASIEFDRLGVWRFRPYTNGRETTVTHDEAPVGDEDRYSDKLILDGPVEWVLVGSHLARAIRNMSDDQTGADA